VKGGTVKIHPDRVYFLLFGFLDIQLNRTEGNNCGNGVFVYELLFAVAVHYHGKIVKPAHISLNLVSVEEEYGNRNAVFTNLIEENVL